MTVTIPDTVSVSALTSSGPITGNLTGNVTGNVTGNLTGNSTGTHTGNVVGGAAVKVDSSMTQNISADGAITILNGDVYITKGSAAAITIAAPAAGTDDDKFLFINSETAFAHVITCASVGFNGKGSSGTLTFGAAKGNSVVLKARNGHWWVFAPNGVTPA
jgi:hypothetical protein